MPKVATLILSHPLDCLFALTVRAEHADFNWYMDRGYIHYQDGGGWIEYEHQLVARLAHGLPDGYHVHHMDGDKLNNCADNLLPSSPSEHARLHKDPDSVLDLTCDHCGAAIVRSRSHAGRNARQFCSEECNSLAQRRTAWPDAETLLGLMIDVGNWCELGRMFGVSDNAVRKWAKRYSLDLSACDGRRR